MEITRKSSISNITHTRDIPVDPEDMFKWSVCNVSIEEAMPYLSNEDREFILSGITKEEWDELFKADMENS